VLSCHGDDADCVRAAYRIAIATLASNPRRLSDLYRLLLSGRYAAGEDGRFDIFRFASGQLVRSDGATGPADGTQHIPSSGP
jgi:hypothetical protein